MFHSSIIGSNLTYFFFCSNLCFWDTIRSKGKNRREMEETEERKERKKPLSGSQHNMLLGISYSVM